MRSILVVCTANVCRSPMAEALLLRELGERSLPEPPVVGSAGTHARDGSPASDGSVAAMRRVGLDISSHRSRMVDADMVDAADLILTMEARHVVDLVADHGASLSRTFALRELAGLLDGEQADERSPGSRSTGRSRPAPTRREGPDRPDASARLVELGAARPERDHLGSTDLDIEDPMGRARVHYRRCASELDQLCGRVVGALWGPPEE